MFSALSQRKLKEDSVESFYTSPPNSKARASSGQKANCRGILVAVNASCTVNTEGCILQGPYLGLKNL